MNIESDFDYLLKLALLGDSTVGKTNLVLRFTENTFSLNVAPTIGYDYKSKTITLKKSKKKAKLQIWDTAGQERYMTLSKTVYQKVDGIILVYDVTLLSSFQNISNWIKIIKEFNDSLPIMLVGNKIDKTDERIITYEEGKKLADVNKINFIETSALNGENVDEAFISFSYEVLEYIKIKDSLNSFSIEKENDKKKKRKKCC